MNTTKLGYIALIVIVCACFACGPASDKTVRKPVSGIGRSLPEGTWILSNYFDSAVKHKTIAPYSFAAEVKNAVILEFKNDSVYTYGSYDTRRQFKLNIPGDTLSMIKSTEKYISWWLIREDSLLALRFITDRKKDTEFQAIYRKNHDLQFNGPVDRYKVEGIVETYFGNSILQGTYHSASGTVNFLENGILKGLQPYDSYKIDANFGYFQGYKKLDVVNLINSISREKKPYNWSFREKELILTAFIPDETGDQYLLGKTNMILKPH